MSVPPKVQTEPYTDLKLLECSRKSSVEVGSGNDSNNAIFMNKVEEGYMLNVGDKVSIHSAVVSEIGAGGNTIELRGQKIGKGKIENLIQVKRTYSEKNNYLDSGYQDVLNRYDAKTVEKYNHEPDLYDNKVSMSLQYYKGTNGENCFSLPRRFDNASATTAYSDLDSFKTGANLRQLRNGTFVESDYSRDRNSVSSFTNDFNTNKELVKVRQDGTKFTLFTRDGTTWYNVNATKPSAPSVIQYVNANGSFDPAVSPYLPVRQLKEIEIPSGRRSADFIAETFTNSLQNASSLEKYYHWGSTPNNPAPSTTDQNQGVLAVTYKTDTFRPFNCANSNFNKTNYDQANTFQYGFTTLNQQHLDWINCFENVGFKRPEFVESGRWDWGNGIFHSGTGYNYITKVSSDLKADRFSMRISINSTYTDENCEKLARWIKTQELYPEFWDFRNASCVNGKTSHVQTQILVPQGNISVGATVIDLVGDPLIVETPPHIESRVVTIANGSFTPNPCTILSSVELGGGVQRVTLDGATFVNIFGEPPLTFTITDVSKNLSSDNSRFLHLDMVQAYDNASKTTAQTRKELGSDMNASTPYPDRNLRYNIASEPLFVTYIKEDENTFYENSIYNFRSQKLSYGLFLKDGDGNIQVTMEGIGGGVPEKYYNASGFFIGGEAAVTNGSYADEKYKRHIGYDPHFSAYGNAAIGLYTPSASGVNEIEQNKSIGFLEMNASGAKATGGSPLTDVKDHSKVINQVYLGSTNPKLTYDSTKDRFGFTEFYTPEYLGNNGAAGETTTTNAIVDGKALVYKINKRLRRQNFCPGMGPYSQNASVEVYGSDGKSASGSLSVDFPNRNIYPFSVMDCQSGISIESFGISDENVWNNSLLGILGFTYDQLQSEVSASNTTQSRVNTGNIQKLNKVTTQAQIKAEDVLIYNQNIWGATMYHPNVLTSFVLTGHNASASKVTYYQWTDPIVVDTGSLTVTAQGVPRKMLSPFFTIRSDLIDESPYMGGADSGERLPIMGHVNKSTDSGDFFVGGDDSVQFTITRQKPLSTITTAITDPSGQFSRVDDNSAIIYKIQRQNQLPLNLVASLFPNGI